MYRQIGAGIFGHTKNVGYVAKSGPIGLIFGAIMIFPSVLAEIMVFQLKKRLATWLEQLEMRWLLADFVEKDAEKRILASDLFL